MLLSDDEFFCKYKAEFLKLQEKIEQFFKKQKKNNHLSVRQYECSGVLLPPRPDEDEYYTVLYSGLNKFPARLKNYIVANSQNKNKIINHLPVILDIEPTSRCNFRCVMCQVRDREGNCRADDMSFESFKNLIDSQYGLVEVKLQGIGEPLMHKDFFRMVQYLTGKNIWTRTTTNASLLNKNDNYKKIVDSQIGEVQISFDGASKEIFEKIRVGSNFHEVVDGVSLLNNYANERNRLISRMWVLVQSYNLHQISEFIVIAKKMGFKRITFSLGISDWGQEEFRGVDLQVGNKKKENIISEIIRLQKSNQDIEITLWDLQGKYDRDNLCAWPFYRAFVGSDMQISPCCMIGNPDVKNLGRADNFSKTWNGELYQNFRQMHIDYDIPKVCQNCYEENS